MSQTPAVGRIVHYVSHGTPPRKDGSQAYTSECRAATITETYGKGLDVVGLAVLNPSGLFFQRSVEHDPGSELQSDYPAGWACDLTHHEGGTWHWPERA